MVTLNNKSSIHNIGLTNLKVIDLEAGNVLHNLKSGEKSFHGFGESYFSKINYGSVKAWKKHTKMIMNLTCPFGEVEFAFTSDGVIFENYIIGCSNYSRLTVPPGIWFGFRGLAEEFSLIHNISNIEHDPNEIERTSLDSFDFQWTIK